MTEPLRVGIVGVGAIGGFLAAELLQGGAQVVLIGRGSRTDTLRATRVDGRHVSGTSPHPVTADYETLRDVDVCLVTVKSNDTAPVADALASVLPRSTTVISFQNGVDNAATLEARLGDRVVPGVIGYNVNFAPDGTRRQATASRLFVGLLGTLHASHLRALASSFERGGETMELRPDIQEVVYGKLLLNLINGVCAATGLGISAFLQDADARWCYATCIREGSRVMQAAGKRPARVAVLPAGVIARALSLPDWIVGPLSRKLAGVQGDARSSTLQDLDQGRPTEIRSLNGAIVTLAKSIGDRAPANALVTATVLEHEGRAIEGRAPEFLRPSDLRARISSVAI